MFPYLIVFVDWPEDGSGPIPRVTGPWAEMDISHQLRTTSADQNVSDVYMIDLDEGKVSVVKRDGLLIDQGRKS